RSEEKYEAVNRRFEIRKVTPQSPSHLLGTLVCGSQIQRAFAAMDFWFRRGVSDEHTLQRSVRSEQRSLSQKDMPSEGLPTQFVNSTLGRDVGENNRLLPQANESGQRSLPIGGERLAQRLLLAGAGGEHPDLPRGRNRREVERDPARRRFGSHHRHINRFAPDHLVRRPGKERGDVSVLAHSQEDQIEHRLSGGVHRRDVAYLRLRLLGRPRRRYLTPNAMDSVRGNAERVGA